MSVIQPGGECRRCCRLDVGLIKCLLSRIRLHNQSDPGCIKAHHSGRSGFGAALPELVTLSTPKICVRCLIVL